MADNFYTNPILITEAGTAWTGKTKKIVLVQWVDDAGDLAHDSTAVLTINGVALTVKIQPLANQLGFGAVAWQIGPFNPGIPVDSFVITTLGTGNLHIWHE
jgi:hypothetical protein